MKEVAIRLRVKTLDEGGYLAISPDVPGLVAEGPTITEAVQIAQDLARKIAESCLTHGDSFPSAFLPRRGNGPLDLMIPVSLPRIERAT